MTETAQAGSRTAVRAHLVETAAALLSEQGRAAVTTRGVAEAAGVQAPTIYRLFGDKDGLLDAVAEHVMASFVSAKSTEADAASLRAGDPLDDLRAGWDTTIAFGLANPAVFALLSDPGRADTSPAARAGRAVLDARIRRVAESGRLRVSEQRAGALIHAAGTGVISTLLAEPPDRRDSSLATTMFDAIVGQILVGAPVVPQSGPTAAAVALRASVTRLDVLSPGEQAVLAEWLDRVVSA